LAYIYLMLLTGTRMMNLLLVPFLQGIEYNNNNGVVFHLIHHLL
jgi:hypothetical protein